MDAVSQAAAPSVLNHVIHASYDGQVSSLYLTDSSCYLLSEMMILNVSVHSNDFLGSLPI